MVRLKDIAAQAGVSVMTVSKVMHDAEDISAATKVRVRAIADRMGYIPDTAAQGLRTRTTRMFGLVIPAMTNPIFARVVMAIEEQAHEMGYDIILAHSHNSVEREEKCIRRLLCRRVDGIFLVPVYRAAQSAPEHHRLCRWGPSRGLLGETVNVADTDASTDVPASPPGTTVEPVPPLATMLQREWCTAALPGSPEDRRGCARPTSEFAFARTGTRAPATPSEKYVVLSALSLAPPPWRA